MFAFLSPPVFLVQLIMITAVLDIVKCCVDNILICYSSIPPVKESIILRSEEIEEDYLILVLHNPVPGFAF